MVHLIRITTAYLNQLTFRGKHSLTDHGISDSLELGLIEQSLQTLLGRFIFPLLLVLGDWLMASEPQLDEETGSLKQA